MWQVRCWDQVLYSHAPSAVEPLMAEGRVIHGGAQRLKCDKVVMYRNQFVFVVSEV